MSKTDERDSVTHRHIDPALPRAAWLVASLLVGLLVVVGNRYGFHRDELYFIAGGHHPAWAQPDNPMLIPLLAAGWHDLVGGRLWAFRILPALAAGTTALIGGLTSRALGGSARDQVATTILTAVTSVVLATGHLFSITTFDLMLTSATLLFLIKAMTTNPQRLRAWVPVGLLAGVALEVKVLIALVLACCLAGILLMGPRLPLRGPGPWLAALIAALLAAPNLVWQATHGWPMTKIAANIAAGGSTSSADRWTVTFMQLLMAGPLPAVVLVVGVVVSLRRREGAAPAWLAVGYLLFLVLMVITGGKAYYPAGLFPALIAAGVPPVLEMVMAMRWRRIAAGVVTVAFSVVTAFFSLPLAPVGSTVFQIALTVNPDTGETVGWPTYVHTVRAAVATVQAADRARTVILARNYGEAGALSRELRMGATDLPAVYSGHNAYADWGPPPPHADVVVVVGRFPEAELNGWFGSCEPRGELTSPPGVDNDEDGAPVTLCTDLRRPWPELWPSIRRLA